MTEPRVWHPFTQLRGFQPRGHIVKAEGVWLTLDNDRRVLDGNASWWVNNHGHAHPHIAAAIAAQAQAFDQVILADFAHGPAVNLTERLRTVLPQGLEHIFYSDDGSTAVEVALKMAVQAQQNVGERQRTRIVAFEGAYHGDTVGAMSVSDRGVFNEPFWGLLFDVAHLPYNNAEAVESWLGQHGSEVAAVIVEPLVQGAGGMVFCEPEFIWTLANACQRAGAILIADEVMTGFGRTGSMFAVNQAEVVPDILCLSKAITGGTLPLGATVCRDAIYQSFLHEEKRRAFLHGHSYTGNPLACAAGVASLELFEKENTLGRVTTIEATYRQAMGRFAALPGVSNVRARGGIFAFEVEGTRGGYLDPVGRRVADAAFEYNLYIRPLGNTLYLMPPFCITEQELTWALDVLAYAVETQVSGAAAS